MFAPTFGRLAPSPLDVVAIVVADAKPTICDALRTQPEPGQPYINSNVFASGCHEHANEYWIYFIDARQVLAVLSNEPRFLSLTPDTGLLDLTATDAAYQTVTAFMRGQIARHNQTDMTAVAVPLVTAVWFQSAAHVPSPMVRTLPDGTAVTNFPDSLALWAGVADADRTALADATCHSTTHPGSERDGCTAAAAVAEQRYWDGIRTAVRRAERDRVAERASELPPPFATAACQRKARFGAGPGTARIHAPLAAPDLARALADAGYRVDFAAGRIEPLPVATGTARATATDTAVDAGTTTKTEL